MDTTKYLIEEYQSVRLEELPNLPIYALSAFAEVDLELWVYLFGSETIGELANNEIVFLVKQLVYMAPSDPGVLEQIVGRLEREELLSAPPEEIPYLPISLLAGLLDSDAVMNEFSIETVGQLAEFLAPVYQLFEDTGRAAEKDITSTQDIQDIVKESPQETPELTESRPLLRYIYNTQALLNDDGEFDHAARDQAIQQAEMMRQEAAPLEASGSGTSGGGAGIYTGGAIGATNIPKGTSAGLHHDNSGWTSLGPHNVGGRTLAILPVRQTVNGSEKDVLYAGAASGGVWYSDDEGANWVPTQDLMPNLAVASLAADPKDATGQTLFAGTGEGAKAAHAPVGGLPLGAGIFKSTDGWSWTQVAATRVSDDNATFQKKFAAVNSLAFTDGGKTLVAATNSGIFYSTDANHENWTQANYHDVMLQGEDAARTGSANTENWLASHVGSGFAYLSLSTKGSITFSPEVSTAGTCTMKIRYSAYTGEDGDNPTVYLKVNESVETSGTASDAPATEGDVATDNAVTLDFVTDTSFDNWKILSKAIEVKAGQNTIKFENLAGGEGNVYIDYIQLEEARFETPNETPVSKSFANLAVHPTNSQIVVAGALMGGSVYLSRDAGKTWHPLEQPIDNHHKAIGRVEVCFARKKLQDSDADVPLYILAEKYKHAPNGVIWKSTDYLTNTHTSYVGIASGLFGGGQGYYDICIWAGDPNDANLIIVGGVEIYRSTNGGANFTNIGDRWNTRPHSDQHFLVEHPDYGQSFTLTLPTSDDSADAGAATEEISLTNKQLFLGNDGGIYTTYDISTVNSANTAPINKAEFDALEGAAWWEMRNHGYTVTQFMYGAGNPNTRVVLAGAQDNGTSAHTPGNYDWDPEDISGGDGSCVAFDPVVNEDGSSVYYTSSQFLNIKRYKRRTVQQNGNRSTSWELQAHIKPNIGGKAGFYAPFKLDPKNSKVLYAGGASLWRTMDATTPNPNRSISLIVNQEDPVRLTFTPTSSESTWQTQQVNVDLQAGNNTLKLQVNLGDTGINIDYVEIGDRKLQAETGLVDRDRNSQAESKTSGDIQYIKLTKAEKDWVIFSHNAQTAGSATLKIRYSTDSGYQVPAWERLDSNSQANALESNIRVMAIGSTSSPPAGANYTDTLSNLILLGSHMQGEIWRTMDANVLDNQLATNPPTWMKIGPEANRTCTYLAIDPENSNIFYACFGGFQAGNLLKTTNGLDEVPIWTDISNGLPNVPVHSITTHPHDSNWLYVGTDIGLFASEDGGVTWAVANEGPASVAVIDMFWMGTTLCVVTYGRGIFQIDIPRLSTVKALIYGDSEGKLIHILPNKAAEYAAAESGADKQALKAAVETATKILDTTLSPMLFIHDTHSLADTSGTTLAEKVDDTLFVGGSDGKLHWLDCDDLTDKWTAPKSVDGAIKARPELWQDPKDGHLCVVVTNDKGVLHIFDLKDETEAVTTIDVMGLTGEQTAEIFSNEIVDNWAYVVSDKGIFAVRLIGDQPGVEWNKEGSDYICHTTPLLAANTLYVTTQSGSLYRLRAFNLRSGTELWSSETGKVIGVPYPPVWSIGTVVVSSFMASNAKSYIRGFDHTSGTQRFDKASIAGVRGGITADDAVLYYVSGLTLHKSKIVPGSTPTDSWTLSDIGTATTRLGSEYAPLAVGNKIYMLGADRSLYCFDTNPASDSTELAKNWDYHLPRPPHSALVPVYPASDAS